MLTNLFEFGLYQLYLCFFAPDSDSVCTLKTLAPRIFLIFIWDILCCYFALKIYRFIKVMMEVRRLEKETNSVEAITIEIKGINSTGLKLNEEESEVLNRSINHAPNSILIEKCNHFNAEKIKLVL